MEWAWVVGITAIIGAWLLIAAVAVIRGARRPLPGDHGDSDAQPSCDEDPPPAEDPSRR